jgi:ABC-type multidrug transport system ATPase subunit
VSILVQTSIWYQSSLILANSAGKSTVLSVLANLVGRTSGSIAFEGGVPRPPQGTLGIVPQKNVLFPELTCYQSLRLWKAVKQFDNSVDDEDIELLLRDCDLGQKIHSNANNLSGGQKRKLQLAIGLVGGSKSALLVYTSHCNELADLGCSCPS